LRSRPRDQSPLSGIASRIAANAATSFEPELA
jgi:hypothetical protein